MRCVVTIEGRLTTLNEYVRAERANRYKAASVKRAETRRVRDKAMERGMRALMRAQLIELHEKYVMDGRGCSVDIKEQATSIYQDHHDLGCNGTGTHLYGELMEARIG